MHPLVCDTCFRVHLDKGLWCHAKGRVLREHNGVNQQQPPPPTHTHTLKALHHFLSSTQRSSDPEDGSCPGDWSCGPLELIYCYPPGHPGLAGTWHVHNDAITRWRRCQRHPGRSRNEFCSDTWRLVPTLNCWWQDKRPAKVLSPGELHVRARLLPPETASLGLIWVY